MSLINVHIYPSDFENESRILKIAKSLTKNNFFDEIILIGRGRGRKKISNKIFLYLFSGANKPGMFLNKVLKFTIWYVEVLFFLRNKKIKMINAHSLSVLPLACAINLLNFGKIQIIYDTHELETETTSMKGISKQLGKIAERTLIKFATHTFVVSKSIENWYKKKYPNISISTIMNVPEKKNILKSDYLRTHYQINNDYKIAIYQGDLGPGRGIEILLMLFEEPPINFCVVFLGNGPLEKLIKSHQFFNSLIFHHDFVSISDLPMVSSSADIGLVLIESASLSNEFCLPNKLFEYCFSGIPVLSTRLVELENFVKNYDIGWILGRGGSIDINELKKLINSLSTEDILKKSMNARGLAKIFNWEEEEIMLINQYKIITNNKKI